MNKITLLKFLTNSNVGSRRTCFNIITKGHVRVNNRKIDQPLFEINTADKIYYDDKLIKYDTRKFIPVYIMLNKPKGYICSVTDENDKPSILNLIKHKDLKNKHLFPVGRLDYLTEGFLFITNDGHFANYLLKAKNKVIKHYYVEIKGEISDDHVKSIKKGIYTKEEAYRVEDIRVLSAGFKTSRIVLSLIEGKNREIRNIFAFLKYKVKILKRFQIGPFKLDTKLKSGEYKLISKDTISKKLPAFGGEK